MRKMMCFVCGRKNKQAGAFVERSDTTPLPAVCRGCVGVI